MMTLLVSVIFGKGLTLDTEFNSTRLTEFTEALALTQTGNNNVKTSTGYFGVCGLSKLEFKMSKTKIKFRGNNNTLEEQRQACSDYIAYVVNVRERWGKKTTFKDILRVRTYGLVGWKKLYEAIKDPTKFNRKYKLHMLQRIVNEDIVNPTALLNDKDLNGIFKSSFRLVTKTMDDYYTNLLKEYNNGITHISRKRYSKKLKTIRGHINKVVYPALRKMIVINTMQELDYNKTHGVGSGYYGVIQE